MYLQIAEAVLGLMFLPIEEDVEAVGFEMNEVSAIDFGVGLFVRLVCGIHVGKLV